MWATTSSFCTRLPRATSARTPAVDAGKGVLLQGNTQGTALDLDHGKYPYVTLSSTTAAGAAIGVGIGSTRISDVVGVVKATRPGSATAPGRRASSRRWTSACGSSPASSGRPWRCGWFDAVLACYAARGTRSDRARGDRARHPARDRHRGLVLHLRGRLHARVPGRHRRLRPRGAQLRDNARPRGATSPATAP